jgi:hypothetical protein
MPLIVQEAAAPRCLGDFTLEAQDQQLTEPEKLCRHRVNEYVDYLATIPVPVDLDTSPRSQELITLRNQYVALFHDRAAEVVGNTLTVQELLYTRYVYQGQFEAKVQRLVKAVIFVGALLTQDKRTTRVNFDIYQGTTTAEQADLLRSIKAAEVIVDVVLKRPLIWKRSQWQAQHNNYIAQLADIGRIGLTDGNIELAKENLTSLQGGFVAQRAEGVKNHYVRRLGFWALLWILVNAALYVLVCRYLAPNVRAALIDGSFSFLADIAWRFRNFFLLAIGSALGAWLAFLFQRPTLRFADLVQLDENLLRPGMRVIFTIVLGTVVGLLFWTGMVVINIGGFSTNFHSAGSPATLIGAFCGIASGAFVAAVSKRAQDFAATVGGSGPTRKSAGIAPPDAG